MTHEVTRSPFVWAYVLQLSPHNTSSRTPQHASDALRAPPRPDTRGTSSQLVTGESRKGEEESST